MRPLAPTQTAGTDIGSHDERRFNTEAGKVLFKSPQQQAKYNKYNNLTNHSGDRQPEAVIANVFQVLALLRANDRHRENPSRQGLSHLPAHARALLIFGASGSRPALPLSIGILIPDHQRNCPAFHDGFTSSLTHGPSARINPSRWFCATGTNPESKIQTEPNSER